VTRRSATGFPRRCAGALLVVAWGAALVGIGAMLLRLGHGPLSTPPAERGVGALAAWARTRDAATMAMSVLRMVALGLDAYLLATTTLGAAARLTRPAAPIHLADRITPRVVRAVLTTALGGLVMAAPVGVPVAGATGPGPARDAGPPLARIAGADPVPLLRRADAASPAAISERPVARPNTHVAPTIGADSSPTVWLVRTGDSFWRIAQSQLTARDPAHGEPTASQIVGYWRLLIAQNRDRLKVREDADLLYPGQRLVIPPLDP